MLALIDLRSQDLRGHNRNPRPASPGSTTEVETVHPLLSCAASTVRSAVLDRTRITRERQPGFPGWGARGPWGCGPRGAVPGGAVLAPGGARMKMAPASAGGGRNAPAGADRQGRSRSSGRVSPEMRPGPLTLTGPQPPERTPVTAKDAHERREGCLLSATNDHILVTQRHLAADLAGRAAFPE